MGKACADFVIRAAGRYFVGRVGGAPIYARRTFFAARFVTSNEARKYILGDLAVFHGCLDSLRVVRMVPSKGEGASK